MGQLGLGRTTLRGGARILWRRMRRSASCTRTMGSPLGPRKSVRLLVLAAAICRSLEVQLATLLLMVIMITRAINAPCLAPPASIHFRREVEKMQVRLALPRTQRPMRTTPGPRSTYAGGRHPQSHPQWLANVHGTSIQNGCAESNSERRRSRRCGHCVTFWERVAIRLPWPRGGVVTQRTANPRTPVQFRAWPP